LLECVTHLGGDGLRSVLIIGEMPKHVLDACISRQVDPRGVHRTWVRSRAVSGSSASFVAWDTLGRMGRTFVATATSMQELSKFHGTDTGLVEPVRVYVGVRSADSAGQRAQLAVREL
jgi:uncharacterized membrane protein